MRKIFRFRRTASAEEVVEPTGTYKEQRNATGGVTSADLNLIREMKLPFAFSVKLIPFRAWSLVLGILLLFQLLLQGTASPVSTAPSSPALPTSVFLQRPHHQPSLPVCFYSALITSPPYQCVSTAPSSPALPTSVLHCGRVSELLTSHLLQSQACLLCQWCSLPRENQKIISQDERVHDIERRSGRV